MMNKLEIKLANGHKIVAELCEYGNEVPPEIAVYTQDENGIDLQNIAVIRAKEKELTITDDVDVGVDVLVWADENNEDYTAKFQINEHDFEED